MSGAKQYRAVLEFPRVHEVPPLAVEDSPQGSTKSFSVLYCGRLCLRTHTVRLLCYLLAGQAYHHCSISAMKPGAQCGAFQYWT